LLCDNVNQVNLHLINRSHISTFIVSDYTESSPVVSSTKLLTGMSVMRYLLRTTDTSTLNSIWDHLDLFYVGTKKTDWNQLNTECPVYDCIAFTLHIDKSVDTVSFILQESFYKTWPFTGIKPHRKIVPWWSKELTLIKTEACRRFRRT